jgi:hypothetical protein
MTPSTASGAHNPETHPKSKWLRYALILGVALTEAIHLPLIVQDPLTNRDDNLLIPPLAELSSLKDYVAQLRSGKILDFQPLRDLSLWLDLELNHLLGLGTFHLTNTLIWIGCLILCARIFRREIRNPLIASACLLLLSVHPAMASTVAWISARKHLLAGLFALVTAELALRKTAPSRWKIPLLYLASLLAQPIHLLLPVWIGLRGRLERRPALIRAALFCLPSAGLIAAINYFYYRSALYTSMALSAKFQSHLPLAHRLEIAALAMGRYFFQLAMPFWVAADYNPSSPRSLVGLGLLPIFAGLSLQRLGAKKAVPWLFFIFSPLLWLSLASTNIFVSDSYLILPAAGFLVLAGSLCETTPALPNPLRLAAGGAWLIAMLYGFTLSKQVAWTWRSDDALWEQAYRVENSEYSLIYKGLRLIEQHRAPDALTLAEELMTTYAPSPLITELYSKAVFSDPDLTIDAKLARLDEINGLGAAPIIYSALLFGEKKNFRKAYELSQIAIARGPAPFRGGFEAYVAQSYGYCLKISTVTDCDSMVEKQRKPARGWTEERFRAKLRAK